MEKYILETKGLTHHFGKQPILTRLDLRVPPGSIFGFLGPNGAGKTTTLRLILGLLRKQEGTVLFSGRELSGHRVDVLSKVGTLIEQPSLYAHLSGTENLQIYRRIYGASAARVGEVLELVGLAGDAARKKAGRYSLGMKQRLAIAIALLPRPELLILDEPTNGLDPGGIVEMRELLQRLNRDMGVTVLVSSHLLAEVEKLVTHVGIINRGRLVFQGTLEGLKMLQNGPAGWMIETEDPRLGLGLLTPHFNASVSGERGLVLNITTREEAAAANRLLVQAGLPVYQLYQQQNNLETLFMELTHAAV
ncbi:ABC transporter ATP-binding protein [Dinghuibacter silviterrae]|uniref:ABC-2 type transport system ATP-binding protein n=1 Tax=Dinghuibacter silviterrae TaxID=1539049 RepID=A0A4R8DMH5_9BACT|nr:ATP-binding cassette domain-containing protein [Dinghuibacter silviterrae]TDW99163.1 ABC-2 type transport system ATP-binding protein [Dinghuibacter silviterrae]